MMEIWPDRCTSLAKKELRYAGVFGVAAWLCGTIFIDRLNHEKALKTMVDTANTIKERNVRILFISFNIDIMNKHKSTFWFQT